MCTCMQPRNRRGFFHGRRSLMEKAAPPSGERSSPTQLMPACACMPARMHSAQCVHSQLDCCCVSDECVACFTDRRIGRLANRAVAHTPNTCHDPCLARVLKLLSEDPANYADAPREGIRRILEDVTGVPHPRDVPLDTSRLASIRMGTTVATNALLERHGERTALLVTAGFPDLLHIANQSRPNIFDLEIRTPDKLYERVVEVDEQVIIPLGDEPSQRNGKGAKDNLKCESMGTISCQIIWILVF